MRRGWVVHRASDRASVLHGRDLDPGCGRSVWVLEAVAPALVLGSTQRDDVVDLRAAQRLGVEVVRRRSGGGAVLLVPGEHVWIDVLIPAGDPLWCDDVVSSFGWLGAAWCRALAALGLGGAQVTGSLTCRTRVGRLVCFAGLAPGEVALGEAKLVGLSQRRTRAGARFQCLVHGRWRRDWYEELLAPGLSRVADPDALAGLAVATVEPGPQRVVDTLVACLPR
ncbi:MAG: hypothetical protein WHS89_00560 [Acidimicrobiales bacterium]